jgi:hypothetical protein
MQDGSLGTGLGSYPGFQGIALLLGHQHFFGWVPHEPNHSTKLDNCKYITVTLHQLGIPCPYFIALDSR